MNERTWVGREGGERREREEEEEPCGWVICDV